MAKVLIVDDDRATCMGLIALFENAGYVAIGVGTFQDAQHALIEHAPDLLITDVRLREYNGLQLIVISPAQIPAIVITGVHDKVLETNARNLGAEYMVKPISPGRLLAVVVEQLGDIRNVSGAGPQRRWPRTRIRGDVSAYVDTWRARILDVSIGGLRLEMDQPSGERLPHWFTLTLPPAKRPVEANIVWKQRTNGTWLFGAAVLETSRLEWAEYRGALMAFRAHAAEGT